MDTSSLEKQVNTIETSVGKLNSQLRFILLGLVGVILIMGCAGAFALGRLFTEVQQQQHAIAQQAVAMDHLVNDGPPPGGPQSQPAPDEDP